MCTFRNKKKKKKKAEKAEAPEGCGESYAFEEENKEKMMKRVKKRWLGSLGANVTPIRQISWYKVVYIS